MEHWEQTDKASVQLTFWSETGDIRKPAARWWGIAGAVTHCLQPRPLPVWSIPLHSLKMEMHIKLLIWFVCKKCHLSFRAAILNCWSFSHTPAPLLAFQTLVNEYFVFWLWGQILHPYTPSISSSYWFAPRSIFRISPLLPPLVLQTWFKPPSTLICFIVRVCLLSSGHIPSCQHVNPVDRVIFLKPKSYHNTLLLITLQCLSISPRVKFKVFTMANKSFQNLAPYYLWHLVLTPPNHYAPIALIPLFLEQARLNLASRSLQLLFALPSSPRYLHSWLPHLFRSLLKFIFSVRYLYLLILKLHSIL